jgi:hypothetical protein
MTPSNFYSFLRKNIEKEEQKNKKLVDNILEQIE